MCKYGASRRENSATAEQGRRTYVVTATFARLDIGYLASRVTHELLFVSLSSVVAIVGMLALSPCALASASRQPPELRLGNFSARQVTPVQFTTAPPEQPETISPAKAIKATTATLEGVLNPHAKADVPVEYDFTYKASATECEPEGTLAAEEFAEGTGKPKELVHAALTHLEPNTTFTFCVLARNSVSADETTAGAPVTFKTLPSKPTILGESVTSVTGSEAHLEAVVNPSNEATECDFEYGATAIAEHSAPCETPTLEGGEQGVGETVTGLTQDTVYRYRVRLENATGEATGAQQEFVTGTPEPPETQGVTGLSATSAVLHGMLNPHHEGAHGSYEFLYAESATECEGGGQASGVASGHEHEAVSAVLSGLGPDKQYTFCLRARNDGGQTAVSPPQTFSTSPAPAVEDERATSLSPSAFELTGEVDPDGEQTTCVVEFGTSTSYGTTRPCQPEDVGAGTVAVPVSYRLEGLSPDVTYHWRLVATNHSGVTFGSDHTLLYDTQTAGLPDSRSYEMVTPPRKNAALIGRIFLGFPPNIAESGARVIMSSIQCFAGANSCTGSRQSEGEPFLFTRSSTGWVTTALAPPATQFEANSSWLLSAEAATALFSMPTPPMSQDDFYVREPSGTFLDVGPTTPPSDGAQGVPFGAATMAATSDFSHVVYQLSEDLWPGYTGTPGSKALYEYAGADNAAPALVGVSGGPGSTSLISGCGTALGGGSNTYVPGELSDTGEVVFFTAETCSAEANGGVELPSNTVFARIGGARTVEISERSPGGCATPACESSPAGDALFVGASVDGSKAFFMSTQQLTDEASEDVASSDNAVGAGCSQTIAANGCNLYEYDFAQPAGRNLIDVSRGDTSGGGPRVQGVVAVSADGSHVYFVAGGVLTTAPNSEGEVAHDGASNLYAFERDGAHPEGHLAFVAQLASSDYEDWMEGPGHANVTPNGRFLVITSGGELTADDTRRDHAQQVFRYDAQTERLARLSIGQGGFNDNGNASSGKACVQFFACPDSAGIVPSVDGIVEAGPSRSDPTMSNDGTRVFFESPVGLTPQALDNAQIGTTRTGPGETGPKYAENVYEWEQEGAGSCPSGESFGLHRSDLRRQRHRQDQRRKRRQAVRQRRHRRERVLQHRGPARAAGHRHAGGPLRRTDLRTRRREPLHRTVALAACAMCERSLLRQSAGGARPAEPRDHVIQRRRQRRGIVGGSRQSQAADPRSRAGPGSARMQEAQGTQEASAVRSLRKGQVRRQEEGTPPQEARLSSMRISPRRLSLLAGTCLAILIVAVPSALASSSPKAGFTLESFPAPTHFSPHSEANSYRLFATNVGGAATEGTPVTLIDTLPKGVTVQPGGLKLYWSATVEEGEHLAEETAEQDCTEPTARTVECVFPEALAPDAWLELSIDVKVDEAEAPTGSILSNEAAVSGGGAGTVSTTAENEVSSVAAVFGTSSFRFDANQADGTQETQAGGHPYEITATIGLDNAVRQNNPQGPNIPQPTSVEDVKDIVVDLPLGLVGSALAAPECTLAQLSGEGEGKCPSDTIVGHIFTEPVGSASVNGPIYNLVPEKGVAAEFGYVDALHAAHVMYAHIVPTPAGYVLQSTTPDIPAVDLAHISVTLYGDPAARDGSGNTEIPFFTDSTSCSGASQPATLYMDSWENPGTYLPDGTPDVGDGKWVAASSELAPATGCNALQFTPELRAQPTTSEADSPSGLNFELKVPQSETASTRGTPALRSAVVTLPEGMTVDPSAANGLGVCSEAQIGWQGGSVFDFTAAPPQCPEDSKLGTLEVETPLLSRKLEGAIYLAAQDENPFGSTFAAYIVVDDPVTGVVVKLAGELTADAHTGRITASFSENPQLPFSDLELPFLRRPPRDARDSGELRAVHDHKRAHPLVGARLRAPRHPVRSLRARRRLRRRLLAELPRRHRKPAGGRLHLVRGVLLALGQRPGARWRHREPAARAAGKHRSRPAVRRSAGQRRHVPGKHQAGDRASGRGPGPRPGVRLGEGVPHRTIQRWSLRPVGRGARRPRAVSARHRRRAPVAADQPLHRGGERRVRSLPDRARRDGRQRTGHRHPDQASSRGRRDRPAGLRLQPDQLRKDAGRGGPHQHSWRELQPHQCLPGRQLREPRLCAEILGIDIRAHEQSEGCEPERQPALSERSARHPGEPRQGQGRVAEAAAVAAENAAAGLHRQAVRSGSRGLSGGFEGRIRGRPHSPARRSSARPGDLREPRR